MMMKLDCLKVERRRIRLILCAGFEDRAVASADRLVELGVCVDDIVLIKFGGPENRLNIERIHKIANKLSKGKKPYEIDGSQLGDFDEWLAHQDAIQDLILFDLTGSSRSLMIRMLSCVYDAGLPFDIIYTEAESYYPTYETYQKLLDISETGRDADFQKAYIELNEYEESEILYSSHCDIEEFADLKGRMRPNYPLFLISFLTFKRGRLSSILAAYETNVRKLVRGVPVREDLKWRANAISIPNVTLFNEAQVHDLETLDWRATYNFLVDQYERKSNKYRYNFLLAPLGSKMQTLACWLFAKERPEVYVITSTPKVHFHDKYSEGARETFLFRDFGRQSSGVKLAKCD